MPDEQTPQDVCGEANALIYMVEILFSRPKMCLKINCMVRKNAVT